MTGLQLQLQNVWRILSLLPFSHFFSHHAIQLDSLQLLDPQMSFHHSFLLLDLQMPFPWIQVLGRLYVVGSLNNMQPKMPKTLHMSISSDHHLSSAQVDLTASTMFITFIISFIPIITMPSIRTNSNSIPLLSSFVQSSLSNPYLVPIRHSLYACACHFVW